MISKKDKSEEYLNRRKLIQQVFESIAPLSPTDPDGAERLLIENIDRDAGAFATFDVFFTEVAKKFPAGTKWERKFKKVMNGPAARVALTTPSFLTTAERAVLEENNSPVPSGPRTQEAQYLQDLLCGGNGTAQDR